MPHLLSLLHSKWPISLNLYGCAGRAKDYSRPHRPIHLLVRSIVGTYWKISITNGDASLQRHMEENKFGLRVVVFVCESLCVLLTRVDNYV